MMRPMMMRPQNGRAGRVLLDHAQPPRRVPANPKPVLAAVREFLRGTDLGVDLSGWGEDELLGLRVESAMELGIAKDKAERLVKAISDAREGK